MMKLRTYKSQSGLFYAISSGVRYTKADCYSKGFKTRKEAALHAKRLINRAEELSLSLWDTNKLPEFSPENVVHSKYIPHYLIGQDLMEVLRKLNQLEFIESK